MRILLHASPGAQFITIVPSEQQTTSLIRHVFYGVVNTCELSYQALTDIAGRLCPLTRLESLGPLRLVHVL